MRDDATGRGRIGRNEKQHKMTGLGWQFLRKITGSGGSMTAKC